jgi:hypothetical protein
MAKAKNSRRYWNIVSYRLGKFNGFKAFRGKQAMLFEHDPYFMAAQTDIAKSCHQYVTTSNPRHITKELYIFLVLYCGFSPARSLQTFRAKYKKTKKNAALEKFKRQIIFCSSLKQESQLEYGDTKSNVYEIKMVLKNIAGICGKTKLAMISKIMEGN